MEQIEAKEHTFKPKIYTSPNRKLTTGGVMESSIVGRDDVFKRVYDQAKVIEKKKEELARSIQEKECTFSPNLEKVRINSRSRIQISNAIL